MVPAAPRLRHHGGRGRPADDSSRSCRARAPSRLWTGNTVGSAALFGVPGDDLRPGDGRHRDVRRLQVAGGRGAEGVPEVEVEPLRQLPVPPASVGVRAMYSVDVGGPLAGLVALRARPRSRDPERVTATHGAVGGRRTSSSPAAFWRSP
ncbi:MAG: hypothetical protein MZW92_31820 [Comamonadaceae bacterium]|nr:hypothetical protein [Comamonadaceae bacterium]